MEKSERTFHAEGWGLVGYANLESFAPFAGFKQVGDLEVNESSEGRLTTALSDKKPERITRRT